jgi:hypothetical protein
MERGKEILSELNDISPVVGSVPFLNIYQVPEGFFDDLPLRVFEKILSGTGSVIPYKVEDDYFAHLPNAILSRIKSLELEDPQSEIRNISPLLGSISKQSPFSTPENYFSELSENVVAGAQAIELVNVELKGHGSLPEALKHLPTYTVPEGYFEGFAGRVVDVARAKKPAKVFRLVSPRVMRFAVAAVTAGIILVAGLVYFNTNNNPVEEINPVVQIETVSEQEMLSFLESNDYLQSGPLLSSAIDDETVIREMLSDIPDDVLQQYVNQYGIPKTDAVN